MEKFQPLKETKDVDKVSVFKNVVRSPFYLCGFVLLIFTTVLIFVSLFTNNWRKTVIIQQEWFTDGVWFTCRYLKPSWLNIQDVFCDQMNYSQSKYNFFFIELAN